MTQLHKNSSGVSDNFALALLKLEQEAHPGANVVLSPVSVSLALGLTMNGSRGPTRQATASALGFGIGRSLRGMNESYSGLRATLSRTTEVDLDLANSLYGSQGLVFKKNFLDKAQQFFDARIRLVDFKDPASIVVMNSYICQKTKGKIPSILNEIENPELAQIILLNAVYFRGFWTCGFDPLLTQPEQFKRLDGSKGDCALMYREGSFSYLGKLKFQAVRLPYGASGRFAMYVFLPLADGYFGLESLLSALDDDGLSACFQQFSPQHGRLFLPRFKVEYASTLNDSLNQLGVSEAFNDEVDFGSMAKGVSKQKITLKHKTVVEVSETGTGSVSKEKDLAKRQSMILPHLPFTMRADRPFCFFVRDEQTQSISIAGLMNNPSVPRPQA